MKVARSSLLTAALMAIPIALTACASVSTRGDRYTITAAELATTDLNNLYDFIARARPHWLPPRGATGIGSGSAMSVYLDGRRLGTPDELLAIHPRSVTRIRLLDAAQAQNRFGISTQGGAILVYSSR